MQDLTVTKITLIGEKLQDLLLFPFFRSFNKRQGMEKRKKWHLSLIIAVIVLTLYNILPTVFYYAKPLKSSIDEKRASQVVKNIADRLANSKKENLDWLDSYCSLLQVKPVALEFDKTNAGVIKATFSNTKEAAKLRRYLSRAGHLIPASYKRLTPLQSEGDHLSKTVLIQRAFTHDFTQKESNFFTFSNKLTNEGILTSQYLELLLDRAATLGVAIAGESHRAEAALQVGSSQSLMGKNAEYLAQSIVDFVTAFGENAPITKRFYASFSLSEKALSLKPLLDVFITCKEQAKKNRIELKKKENLSDEEKIRLPLAIKAEELFTKAAHYLKNHLSSFQNKSIPLNYEEFFEKGRREYLQNPEASHITLDLENHNPFIRFLQIDWKTNEIQLVLHKDYLSLKNTGKNSHQRDLQEQLLINEIARVTNHSGESLKPCANTFIAPLSDKENFSSFLMLNLQKVAEDELLQAEKRVKEEWRPKHPDLSPEFFPVVNYEEYRNLPSSSKEFCLLFYSPHHKESWKVSKSSLYILAKGLEKILEKYEADSQSESANLFFKDLESLAKILQSHGFRGYPGNLQNHTLSLKRDFIFEKPHYYQNLLAATKENFQVKGSQKYAKLEFTNLAQRIHTENQIDQELHEELLKAKDDYQSAQVSLDPTRRFDAPKPTKSTLWNNFVISFKKYFRGDEKKVLHWGLDLSGGKTVSLELLDANHKRVENDQDLKEGINELYNRVNKMGVSEVSLHQEGTHIVLDFPGSQDLSASELIKASTMYFHVINEKYSIHNPSLGNYVQHFLQQIWNEAVVTQKKDTLSLQKIARKHLYGDRLDPNQAEPRNEAAKVLFDQGLRLADPEKDTSSYSFDDSLCKLGLFRGEGTQEWQNQSHPLVIMFHNYSIEGKDLVNVHSSYDPSKGNFLSFEVSGSSKDNHSPSDNFYAWTSPFSKDRIAGTSYDFLGGKGWRMAVVLNDTIICAPTLDQGLRNSASISGNFSHREISQLVLDLKAGSLTFTPKILSEKNVSPELGAKDRQMGIFATLLALLLVIAAMSTYYRFSGIIASIAVLFNLLIMWAIFQNLDVTLTLASIAGVILTVGMAVDANVLVFERVKEELALGKKVSQAVASGYKKAFTAIFDSNLTTILAALILLNFDAGPIKGFAVTIIIGIASSMFTALFMTRFFFSYWTEKNPEKNLSMANWIGCPKINFLKKAPFVFAASLLLIGLGTGALLMKKNNLFGMDFTGGYSLQVELTTKENISSYRKVAENALLKAGAASKDIQVRELSPSNFIKIKLGTSMEEEGKPFYNLPLEKGKEVAYSFEKNPRIEWIVKALAKENLEIEKNSLLALDKNWSSMSGQMSSSMRNHAIFGLSLALLCMLVYITFRFEFSFAVASLLCILHDVLLTVACIFVLIFLGMDLSFDLHTIAALMTIIGYSVNDTIIIFDRIREDRKRAKKGSFSEVINKAISETLNRTTITSGTTLLVLLALVFLGGSSLFSFSLVMTLGVVFGTLSSIFIAPLFLQYLENKEKVSSSREALQTE